MSDIYNILSKHFAGEANAGEEHLVRQFKLDKPEEYETLHSFWTTKELSLSEFNTAQAWQKVTQKAKPQKRVQLYLKLRKVAAVAAVFIMTMAGLYYYNNTNSSPELLQITSLSQKEKVTLADGSFVYLNKGARLTFPAEFDSDSREVSLQGKAFFEVAKEAKRPFIVHTRHSDVKVLGTSFNINTQTAQTEIAVATGKVKVRSLTNQQTAILSPNQSAVVTAQKLEAFSTKNKNYLAWKTGVFHFEESKLQEVVEDLNTYYDNRIQLFKTDKDCLFTSTFKQRDLKEIMEIIQLSCDLQLRQKNGDYELY